MKIAHFLITTLLLLNAACNTDDDNNPIDPADALPPATKTGAQTFGCLINGEPFLPPIGGNDRPSGFYQFIDGAYSFIFSASVDKGGGSLFQTVSIGGIDVEALSTGAYELKEEKSKSYFGFYLLGGGTVLDTSTTDENPGTLTITRFDDEEFIVSGTFEFTAFDNEGDEIKITDGRFDLNYTN